MAISRADTFTALHELENFFYHNTCYRKTLKKRVSTHTRLINTEMLDRSQALSILDAALDFTDCMSNKNI